LDILFACEDLQRLCHDDAIALRAFKPAVVRRLRARLDDLTAAASLSYAAQLPGRFHPLLPDRPGHFGILLGEGFRLVITSAGKSTVRRTESLNLNKVIAITVVAIEEIHA